MSAVDDRSGAPGVGVRAKFPRTHHPTAGVYFAGYIEELNRAASAIDSVDLDRAAALLVDAYVRDAMVFSCGNGGSAAIANHLQCDHTKGVRTNTDLSPRVTSLSANVELITAIANDSEYADIFRYQLESQARQGDVLLVISSSGRSANIVRALLWAREHNLHTIALTGFDGGDARVLADVAIHVDSDNYGVIEDLHQSVMHALAQHIRHSRMTADAVWTTVF